MGANNADNRYWNDPSGNIRRMEGEQDVIATVTDDCSNEELLAMVENLNRPVYVDGMIADNDRLRMELEAANTELARMRPVVEAAAEFDESCGDEICASPACRVARAMNAYRAFAGKGSE